MLLGLGPNSRASTLIFKSMLDQGRISQNHQNVKYKIENSSYNVSVQIASRLHSKIES